MGFSRLGEKNAAGNTNNWTAETALFQSQYLTDVIRAFQTKNVMKTLHRSRHITKGKSATFPALWKTDAKYHLPGVTAALAGSQTVAHNEVIINVDRLLLSDIMIYSMDELMNHFDVRSEYAEEQGIALSDRYDKYTLQLAVLASRLATARVTGVPTGPFSKTITTITSASDIEGACIDALAAMEERDVPVERADEMAIVMKPSQYWTLVKAGKVVQRDYGGMGSVATGMTGPLGGVTIYRSNNLPTTDKTPLTGADAPTTNETDGVNNDQSGTQYFGDFSKTRGVVFHKSAISTVTLLDLTLEQEYMIEHQGHLSVAKQAVGHGITRGEASTELVIP